jgi:hypothetical protein
MLAPPLDKELVSRCADLLRFTEHRESTKDDFETWNQYYKRSLSELREEQIRLEDEIRDLYGRVFSFENVRSLLVPSHDNSSLYELHFVLRAVSDHLVLTAKSEDIPTKHGDPSVGGYFAIPRVLSHDELARYRSYPNSLRFRASVRFRILSADRRRCTIVVEFSDVDVHSE